MNPQPIRFFHRGRIVTVDDVQPTRSVLDWLREQAGCTGTKEGCNEGDCGACTVVIGELADADADADAQAGGPPAALTLRSVNACIRFLPTLDGKALFTVEDLRTVAGGLLHPVQQAMVDCHGSQCGFCTPGFVMSLWSAYERHRRAGTRPTRQALADELSGNLCRCTGYRPIVDAGQRMFDLPAAPLDIRPVVEALAAIARPVAGIDEPGPFAYVAPARSLPDGTRRADRFFAPRTVAELAELRERLPDARLLAGATDIGLWVNKQFRDVGDLIWVGEVAALKRIDVVEGALEIGAAASLEDAWRELAARIDGLTDVWLRFASPPVRHAGTMGGNVANGSPIGDAPPVLLALDAQIRLRRGADRRTMPLADFYTGYLRNRLLPGEFLESIRVPLPLPPPEHGDAGPATRVRAYKISKRFDCDISALLGAFAITLDGGLVTSVRFAWGGMAATVIRSHGAEAAVQGKPWTRAAVDAAKAALAVELKPLSDLRASEEHRLLVAQNLIERFWLETREDAPLLTHEVSVFALMPHAPAAAARR